MIDERAGSAAAKAGASEVPVRLLAVMADLGGGGAERQMILLLKHLDRRRFEPLLCLFARKGSFVSEVPSDVPVMSLGKNSRWDAPRLVRELAGLVRTQQPDVVLSKLDYTNVIATLGARLSGSSPAIVLGEESLQSAELAHFTHRRIRRSLIRFAYRHATRVVTPSPGIAEDLRDVIKVRRSRFDVIPNMVELDAIRQAAQTFAPHPFVGSNIPLAVSVGRLAHGKGQADLVAAAALVNSTRPLNLLILGDGENRAQLEALVADLGLGNRVAFMGFVANPFAVMVQADVFVLPSHWESFGNVLVEAMALGLPVISTRVPSGPEWIVDDGQTGIFARPRDPEDLAAKLTLLIEDRALAAAIAERGREATRRFDVGPVVASYQHLLESAARSPAAPQPKMGHETHAPPPTFDGR